MRLKVLLVGLALLMLAQVEGQQTIKQYLRKNTRETKTASFFSNNRNNLKVNSTGLFNGELTFSYEQFLGKYISVQISSNILMPYYTVVIPPLRIDPDEIPLQSMGIGYSIEPRIHLGNNRWRVFGGFLYTRNSNISSGVPTRYIGRALSSGITRVFNQRVNVSIGSGLGIAEIKRQGFTDIDYYIPLRIEIGYVF